MKKLKFVHSDTNKMLCITEHIKVPHFGDEVYLSGYGDRIFIVVGTLNMMDYVEVAVTDKETEEEWEVAYG